MSSIAIEKDVGRSPSAVGAHINARKSRSCNVCRGRRVKCDRLTVCSNCRRANIACVYASSDRPPRWARRFERINSDAASNALTQRNLKSDDVTVAERLRNLEDLVKDLCGQLDQAHASKISSPDTNAGQDRNVNHDNALKQSGRLVFQDTSGSRYVSSDFWSHVKDELDELKMNIGGPTEERSDYSDDVVSPKRSPPTQENEQTLPERHALLFGHDRGSLTGEIRDCYPLPSQIPFLLNVFQENVNAIAMTVHMPSVRKMLQSIRGGGATHLAPSDEALMFAICYSAVTSMEEDDVMTSFGNSKSKLSLQYRRGLETALAKADFLNEPNIVILSALVLFLCLLRQHESGRWVWMMTGIVIRIAQYLGLHRDGTLLKNLTPFEIEMRRRVWWAVVKLDWRASDDQGTPVALPNGSFDTKMPLNINDADISPESKEMPMEHDGLTESSLSRIDAQTIVLMKQLVGSEFKDGAAGLEDRSRLLDEIYLTYERGYFRYTTDTLDPVYWIGLTIARLIMAKMTLIVFLPVLSSSPSENFSEQMRTKLLVSAIEVAEYNHALHADQACRKYRWMFQAFTHWHAIVYLLIEASRRPWSCLIERAWIALHSSWLIPAQDSKDTNSRMWFPLRKLMAKTRRHRDQEINRLRTDPRAAARLYDEDRKLPLPSSTGVFPNGSSVDYVRDRWRKLVCMRSQADDSVSTAINHNVRLMHSSITSSSSCTSQSSAQPNVPGSLTDWDLIGDSELMNFGTTEQLDSRTLQEQRIRNFSSAIRTNSLGEMPLGHATEQFHSTFDIDVLSNDMDHWLWGDTNPSVDVIPGLDMGSVNMNMDLEGMDWYSWVDSLKV